MRFLICEHLHQRSAGGWRSPGVLHVDNGQIVAVSDSLPEGAPQDQVERLSGLVVPGMPNLHSHAFQRALAGLTERADRRQQDSFWTWRDRMYRLALALSPQALERIAAQLYVEMLEAGMTAVGEFHYLHHGPDGAPYQAPEEMSLRIFEAAKTANIALTHLPVLYRHGGFGTPPSKEQRRFVHHSADDFLRLVQALRPKLWPRARLGIAPHSLRAVDPQALTEAVRGLHTDDPEAPVHIHIAEQTKEVEDCEAALGARPVQWLLEHQPVDGRWCLVHATHMHQAETLALARSGAVAGLCPSTEANLGDGIFAAPAFVSAKGAFGIGSDSHVTIDVAEELRLLEYGQRLRDQRRNVVLRHQEGGDDLSSVGRFPLRRSASGRRAGTRAAHRGPRAGALGRPGASGHRAPQAGGAPAGHRAGRVDLWLGCLGGAGRDGQRAMGGEAGAACAS